MGMEDSNVSPVQGGAPETAGGTKQVTIELDPADGAGEAPSRQDKRNQRRDDLVAESRRVAEEAERRARDAEERAKQFEERYNRDISEIRQSLSQRQQQAAPEPDAAQKEYDELYKQREQIWENVRLKGDKITQDDIDKAQKTSRELEMKGTQVIARAEALKHRQQVDPSQVAFQAQNQDVLGNPQMKAKAQALILSYTAEGAQLSQELVSRALVETREWWSAKTGKSKPNSADKSRLRGGSVGGATGKPETVSVSASDLPRMQRMADTVYSYINSSDESQAKYGHTDDGSRLRLQKYLRAHQKK